MFRAFVGNLHESVTANDLDVLFHEHELYPLKVIVKSKYAFVDFEDQASLSHAIDLFNGKS